MTIDVAEQSLNKTRRLINRPQVASRSRLHVSCDGQRAAVLTCAALICGLACGCSSNAPTRSVVGNASRFPSGSVATTRYVAQTQAPGDPEAVESVEAVCPVPAGWVAEPLKQGNNHKHQIWISPSGHTAYGVLLVSLPFPAALLPTSYRLQRVLDGFLAEMKKREGRADLIERSDAPELGGIRFVAEGGQYKVHANLIVRGLRAWFVYAGTRQDESVIPDELAIAEQVRDGTKVGLSP